MLAAIDAWSFDPVKWMFSGDKTIDADVDAMVGWRQKALAVEDFLRTFQHLHKFDGWKEDTLRAKLVLVFKQVKDRWDCMCCK